MKRFSFRILIISVFCIGWLCCIHTAAQEPESAGEEKSVEEQVNEILAGMSTEQKLAQMMIVTLRSDINNTKSATEITPSYEELLEKYDFGGVILFAGNIVDMEQTITLIRDCQAAAMNSAQGIPMLICVDQEGGRVNRVSLGTLGSGCMSLAATGDLSLTEECADMLGEEISAHDAEGNGPFNLNVAAAVCAAFGESVPQGTLPVNVPKLKETEDGSAVFSDELLYERGFGLQDWA